MAEGTRPHPGRDHGRPGEEGMNYRVEWSETAEQELARIWLGAADRNAISRAAHAIDQELQRDPNNAGESRSDGERIIIHSPLAAKYHVDQAARTVRVFTVWRIR